MSFLPSVRSYEEVEKRRSDALSGGGEPPRYVGILLVVFLAFAALTIYLLAGSSLGIAPANFTLPEATALVAAGSLFAYRLQTRRRRQPNGKSFLPALVDAVSFLGIVALAAWTFVFPVLYPLPQETAVIGVYSLILIAAMIVVLRFASPGLRARSDDAYSNIESSLRQLGKAVEQLSRRVPQSEGKTDPAVAERLSAMMGEVAAMKKELSTMKSSGPALAGASNVKSVRVMAPQVKAVVTPLASKRDAASPAPEEPIKVVAPEGGARWTAESGVSVPEATVDNPWLDVLGKRRTKAPSAG
jgi:hypothetical protein